MNDLEKSKDQLIEELEILRQRVADQVKKEDEYKRIERDFKKESAQRQSLLEGVSNFVIFQLVQDKKNPSILHVAFVSPSVKEILGISEPYRIKTLFEIMHSEDVERVRSANQKAIDKARGQELGRGISVSKSRRIFRPCIRPLLYRPKSVRRSDPVRRFHDGYQRAETIGRSTAAERGDVSCPF
jgi:hypothetical protein